MHKPIWILFFLMWFFSVAQAQDDEVVQQDSTIAVVDNTIDEITDTTLYYTTRAISPDSIATLKRAKPFTYVHYLDSLLKDKQASKKPQSLPKISVPGTSWFDRLFSSFGVRIFLWVLAGFFVLFILYKLFLSKGVFQRNMRKEKSASATVEEEVLTSDSDFDAMIQQAIRAGNYRLAVRYQYLKTLHKLAAKNLIQLAVDKTNYQYVREVNNPQLQNEFAAVTLSYEYVWYGEFSIETDVYGKIAANFKNINSKI